MNRKGLAVLFFLVVIYAKELKGETRYKEKPVQMRTTSPNQEYLDIAFSIYTRNNKGLMAPTASGFYMHVEGKLYGVTARHVVQTRSAQGWGGLIRGLYRRTKLDAVDGAGSPGFKKIDDFCNAENSYFFHSDPSVDLAIFPTIRAKGESLLAPGDGLFVGDEDVQIGEAVYVHGFPFFYGQLTKNPVVRNGTIATKLTRNLYLLDSNAWPGDSGAVIVSKPYFGVPKGKPSTWQWQAGGKVIGIQSGLKSPKELGLPERYDVESFRYITSAQTVLDVLDSEAFRSFHRNRASREYCN